MNLLLNRFLKTDTATFGCISDDRGHQCFTLENPIRAVKIKGETAIPVGKYEIILRTNGGMNTTYANRFDNHQGMLWLQNVDDFEWVYIHIGNKVKNTDGCILVGSSCDPTSNFIGHSTDSYLKLYDRVITALEYGERVFIEVV